MKTFSKAANQCHFVPLGAAILWGRNPAQRRPIPSLTTFADGDCANPFREGLLNRLWTCRSGMKTFSNVANQCHFVPLGAAILWGAIVFNQESAVSS
jgi:hypothetical protein